MNAYKHSPQPCVLSALRPQLPKLSFLRGTTS